MAATSFRHPLHDDERLFFLHIPKAAGTTLIRLLDTHYMLDEIMPVHYDVERLRTEYSHRLNDYRFIRGHLPYDDIIDRLDAHPRVITVLRDPVTRFISEYEMRARLPDPLVGLHDKIQQMSLADFLDDEQMRGVFANRMTRLIASQEKFKPTGENNRLSVAKQRLAEFDFVGLQEHFDDSVTMLIYHLGFPPVPGYRTMNVSPRRDQRDEIDPDLLARVAEVNTEDVELYDLALERYEAQKAAYLAEQAELESQRFYMPRYHVFTALERVAPGQGWHTGKEIKRYGRFRWTGPGTTTHLYLPLADTHDLIVQFRMLESVTDAVLDSLTLTVNGHVIPLTPQHEPLTVGTVFTGTIPQAALQPSPYGVCLTFEVAETINPQDLDPTNDDKRHLGFSVNWLHVYPA